MDKVIVICGPTAVGKTKLAIELAKKLNTEIISGDAYQIYKNMDIGTAKPTTDELSEVKHHLISIIDSTNEYSVCDYQKEVRSKIEELTSNNLIPIICGGTGLYIDSVLTNYDFSIKYPEDSIDLSFYEKLDNDSLYNELSKLNHDASTSIDKNNRKRVLQAIKNILLGKDLSVKGNHELLYDPLVIFLNDDRDELYKRINTRVDEMISQDLIEEVKYLFDNNLFSKTSKEAIGYKELVEFFEGKVQLDDAIENIKKASRHYAKRQLTWFRHKFYTTEVMIDSQNFNNTIDYCYSLIKEFLNKKSV